MWHPALSITLSKSNKWPALHYVHQNMRTGEFAASDNRMLLVENNGTPPLAEWWNPDGSVADVQGLEYPAYYDWISDISKLPPSKLEGVILPEQLTRVREFIGADYELHSVGYWQLYTSADGCRKAIIYAYESKGKWRLLDTDEELIQEFDTYEDARLTGEILGCDYIIRRAK